MPDVGGLSNLIKDIPQDEGFAGNRGALFACVWLICRAFDSFAPALSPGRAVRLCRSSPVGSIL